MPKVKAKKASKKVKISKDPRERKKDFARILELEEKMEEIKKELNDLRKKYSLDRKTKDLTFPSSSKGLGISLNPNQGKFMM